MVDGIFMQGAVDSVWTGQYGMPGDSISMYIVLSLPVLSRYYSYTDRRVTM